MNESGKKTLALIILLLLTIGGLLTAYQALFDLWMTAYPYADVHVWSGRLWIRLATTVVIAVLWSMVFAWFIKARQRSNSLKSRHS